MNFEYGEEAILYLKKKDKALSLAIDKIGQISREVDPDLFSSVVHHIIGQQISTAAQNTIWLRLQSKLSVVNEETISNCSREELQSCGMTFKKADYILEFANKVKNEQFDLKKLRDMPDNEVIAELSSLSGIGVWTAEMLLIFCLQRPDVVSYGDLAIHRGMRMLYHHRKIDKKLFAKYAKRYSPYGTVASLYLWAIAGGAIPDMKDYAPKRK